MVGKKNSVSCNLVERWTCLFSGNLNRIKLPYLGSQVYSWAGSIMQWFVWKRRRIELFSTIAVSDILLIHLIFCSL